MRIGIDVRALMESRTTGVQAYIKQLLHALFALDQSNNYILFANGAGLRQEDLPKFDYPNVSYQTFNYPNKLLNLAQKFFAWPKLDRMLGGVDLFFSPHWRTAALSSDVPLVITFHDLSFELVPEFFSLKHRLWHRFMGYRGAARRADRLIAVSESTKRDLVDVYGVGEHKVFTIHSGAGTVETEGETLIDLPEKFFLYFATFEPRKNIHGVMDAYQDYRKRSSSPLPLVLAGSSGWKTSVHIPDELKPHVKVYQDVSSSQRHTLYRNSHVLLMLSFYEGFGLPLLEAAAYGKPAITSFASSLQEVGRGFSVFVNPFRPREAADAMLELELDRGLYEKLSREAELRAREFDWTKTAQLTLELFQEYDR